MERPARLVVSAMIIGATAAVILLAKITATAQQNLPDSRDTQVALVAPLSSIHPPATLSVRHPPFVPASEIVRYGNPEKLFLRSEAALVLDERENIILYERNIDEPRPIASLTKLMTALVLREKQLPMDELIEITRADRDRLRGSSSRLRYGVVLTRYDMLRVALAASDNRAAAALARTYPGGWEAMIEAMNDNARALGMTQTRFADPTGLDSGDISTARDLVKLLRAVYQYPLLRSLSTSGEFEVTDWHTGTKITFRNTNYLVRNHIWDISLSKTGYTADAGNCLLMSATVANRPVVLVLLDSWGKLSKYGDANRVRQWLLASEEKAKTLTKTADATGRGAR